MGDREFLSGVADYFTRKVEEHGTTSRGADWNTEDRQFLSFSKLAEVFEKPEGTVIDYGCGFGAFADYLKQRDSPLGYVGYDITPAMIEAGRKKHPELKFTGDRSELTATEYCISSGIFNIKLDVPSSEWEEHVKRTVADMRSLATVGFAFNLLTSYSDEERKRPDLYYGDPREYFDFCHRNFSRRVAVLHDYEAWEFTVVVRL